MARILDVVTTLNRKRLFQIGIVYVGVAWAVLEMVDFAIANYDLSRKLLDVSVLLLILGLPAVLIIGWYHGEKGHQQVVRTELSLLLTLFVMAAVGTYRISTAEEVSPAARESSNPVQGDARFAAVPANDLGARSVAVFPFIDKTAVDSLAWLGPAVADMLTTNLAQVPEVRVVSRERLLGLLRDTGQEETDEIPQSLAGEIAARSGARLMVRGSIIATGDDLALDAQLIELQGGTVVGAERARGSDVFALVDSLSVRLTGRLLSALPERPRPELAPIAVVTTPKLEAYREFHEGVRAERMARVGEAKSRFEKAVELDPSFTLAMLKLAESEAIDSAEALRYLKLAQREIGKIPAEYREPLKALVQLGGEGLAVVLDSIVEEAVHEIRVDVSASADVDPRPRPPRPPSAGADTLPAP